MAKGYLVVAVLAALAAGGCGSREKASIRIDPALATLVPPDAGVLAGVRLDKLRETAIYRKWAEGKGAGPLEAFARDTGVDPGTDVWELLFAANGRDSVVMARGKFSPHGLEPRLEREGAKRMSYKGYTLLGTDERAVAFINPSTAVAGRPAALHAVIDNRNDAPSPGVKALMERAGSISADNQVWMVSSGPAPIGLSVPESGNLANLGKFASMVESVTAAADVRSGVKAYVDGQCRSEKDAKQVHDALRGLIGFARLTTRDGDREMLRVYDGISVEQNDSAVYVRAEIPADVVDSLIAQRAAR